MVISLLGPYKLTYMHKYISATQLLSTLMNTLTYSFYTVLQANTSSTDMFIYCRMS